MARSTGEKVIVVIGTGLALAVTAGCVSWLVLREIYEPSGGWFAYAPDTGPMFHPDAQSDQVWAALWAAAIWLAAVGLWVGLSLRVWRGPDEPRDGAPRGFLARMRQRG